MAALDGVSVSLSIWEPEHTRLRCVLNDGDLGPGEVLEPEGEYYGVSDYAPVIPLLEQQQAFTASVQDQGSYGDLVRRLGKGSCVVAPIPLDGRVWGELFVTRSVDQPTFGTGRRRLRRRRRRSGGCCDRHLRTPRSGRGPGAH